VKFDLILNRINLLHEIQHQAPIILKALGLGDYDLLTPISHLSGGQKTRLMLSKVLMLNPQLLILDEPINHLDIPSRTQFEKALSEFEGTILAVVHDRYFIEGFAAQIWEVKNKRIMTREKL